MNGNNASNGTALNRTACLLCKAPVLDEEPFLTALVFSGGELVHRPFHLTCHSRDVAQLVADALAEHLGHRSEEGNIADIVAAVIARLD